MSFKIGVEGIEVHVEYLSCGSHRLNVQIELDEEGCQNLKKQMKFVEDYLEAKKAKREADEKRWADYRASQIPVTDEETMGDYNTL